MPEHNSRNRRSFMRGAFFTFTALPAAGFAVSLARPARADEHQAEDGHALEYVNDATDAAGHEAYEEGQSCENCIFWSGESEGGWGECMHPDFQDVLVNSGGWCSAYLARG